MNRVALLVRTPAVALYDFDHPPAIAHCDPEGEVAGRDSINVVEAGTFRVRSGGGTFDFSPGTMFLATRGMEFSCSHDVEVPFDRCLSVSFEEDSVEALRTADVPALRPPMANVTANQNYLRHRLRSCIAGEEMRFELLAGALYESLSQSDQAVAPRAAGRVSHLMRSVDRAVDRIEVDYASPLTLCDLAASALLSPFHFARAFRALVGLPPHRYLTAVRLRHAARLLDEGASVTFTCYATGFASPSHFVTVFRQRFGIVPSDVRRGIPCPTLRASLRTPIFRRSPSHS